MGSARDALRESARWQWSMQHRGLEDERPRFCGKSRLPRRELVKGRFAFRDTACNHEDFFRRLSVQLLPVRRPLEEAFYAVNQVAYLREKGEN